MRVIKQGTLIWVTVAVVAMIVCANHVCCAPREEKQFVGENHGIIMYTPLYCMETRLTSVLHEYIWIPPVYSFAILK